MRAEINRKLKDFGGIEIGHVEHLLQVAKAEAHTLGNGLSCISSEVDVLLSNFKQESDSGGC